MNRVIQNFKKCQLFFFFLLLSAIVVLSFCPPTATISGSITATQDSVGSDKFRIDSAECALYKINIPVDSFENDIDAYWYKGFSYDLILDTTDFPRVATTYSDKAGNFKFTNIAPGNYIVRTFFYNGGYSRLAYNLKITANEKLTVKIVYPDYCEYYKHRYSRVCPKCNKSDNVVEIYYGEPSRYSDEMEAKGKLFFAGECRLGECMPNWYCKRDSLKF